MRDPFEVRVEKIKVFENKQDQTGRDDAHREKPLSPGPFRILDPHTGEIIDEDRDDQDENIDGDEKHVKHAAGQEEPPPAVFMRQ